MRMVTPVKERGESVRRLLSTAVLVAVAFFHPYVEAKQRLTLRDAIETTRFMVGDKGRPIIASPDESRYVVALVRGDVDRDRVEVEVMGGRLESLQSAQPVSVAKLYTKGLGKTSLGEGNSVRLLLNDSNLPRWIDERRVALLWEDERGVHQILAIDVEAKEHRFLTHSETDVTSFTVGPGGSIIFVARMSWSPEQSNRLIKDGFAVRNSEALSLLLGATDGTTLLDLSWGLGEVYVQQSGSAESIYTKVHMQNGSVQTYSLGSPSIRPEISPDGRLAILSGTPESVPEDWDRYEGIGIKMVLPQWKVDRRAGKGRLLQQPFVLRVGDASARPLWDAPVVPTRDLVPAWSPDSRSVILGPTYLPGNGASQAGLRGTAVVEVNAESGQYVELPISSEDVEQLGSIRWLDSTHVDIKTRNRIISLRKASGRWEQQATKEAPSSQYAIRVEVRQDPNTPPVLYAIENGTGREVLVFDPNPTLLATFSLGKVEFVSWTDSQGNNWEGRLFLPVGYKSGQRYPLVLQTRTWGRREDFTLYGQGSSSPTLGPGWSVYLAQPLANRGIAVLQVGPPPQDSFSEGTHLEGPVFMRGYESAVEHLSRIGLVDRHHVGIMGHSRAGWHIEYTLAFSDLRFAAAIADDNIDSGYFETGMRGWMDAEKRNGSGEPFGAGMKDWLENSPAFNVEHIDTPLLMLLTGSFLGSSGVVVQGWEMFSRLRYLKKPVEFYVAPNIERGSHTLQNPSQTLAVQGRAMDWWLYWLKDERDTSDAKREQYAGWDKLRELRDEDTKRPKPPRLRWTAEPVTAAAAAVN